ncbi:tetratricopeptide repeat protein [Pantoea tagorei]
MLKVGVIMQEKKDTAKAKAVFQQVIKLYPNTDSAKQAQKTSRRAVICAASTGICLISGLAA